jgi:hypothetical protein
MHHGYFGAITQRPLVTSTNTKDPAPKAGTRRGGWTVLYYLPERGDRIAEAICPAGHHCVVSLPHPKCSTCSAERTRG